MRHRKRGRTLGRSSSHRRAMLRNLASSLILTERDAEFDPNPPKVKGRVVTTLQKAKEVRPLVEKCITIARKSLDHSRAAEEFATDADRNSDQWRQWRHSDDYRSWNQARAPVVAARRYALRLLGDKQAVEILFSELAPRLEDRNGGYTRILKLSTPRLGDAGEQAILEFVGVHDRVAQRSEKPLFDDDAETEDADAQDVEQEVDEQEDVTASDDAAETEDAKAEAADDAADGDAADGDAADGDAEDGEEESKK